MNARRREAITGHLEKWRHEPEHVALRAVAPVVVGKAEQAAAVQRVRAAEQKHRHFVVVVALDELHQVIVVIQEQIGERDPEQLLAETGDIGEKTLVDGSSPARERLAGHVGRELIRRLQWIQLGLEIGRIEQRQPVECGIGLIHVEVDVERARDRWRRNHRFVER